MKMEVKYGDAHCELTIPHFEYGSVIGGSLITPYSILKVGEAARASSGPFLEEICRQKGQKGLATFFVKWQQIEIFPEFYNRQITPSNPRSYINFVSRKMKVHHCLLPIGKSSQFLEDTVIDVETGKPLFLLAVLIVNIDPATRKPAPFPSALKSYFTPERCENRLKINGKLPPSSQKRFEPPSGDARIFSRLSVINVRHIDRNRHVNQAVYANICYDCLGDAFSKSFFGDHGSIFDHSVRRMSLLYISDCGLGDKIDTIVWQDETEPLVFKFHIKKSSSVICQAEFQMFGNQPYKRSRL